MEVQEDDMEVQEEAVPEKSKNGWFGNDGLRSFT